jgi:hypothetical protein
VEPDPGRPLVLAHRAGNRLSSLRQAEAVGVDVGGHTRLMLDLKGIDAGLAPRVRATIADHDPGRVAVCSRRWRYLIAFEGVGVRRIVDWGVTGIITDRPAELLELCRAAPSH